MYNWCAFIDPQGEDDAWDTTDSPSGSSSGDDKELVHIESTTSMAIDTKPTVTSSVVMDKDIDLAEMKDAMAEGCILHTYRRVYFNVLVASDAALPYYYVTRGRKIGVFSGWYIFFFLGDDLALSGLWHEQCQSECVGCEPCHFCQGRDYWSRHWHSRGCNRCWDCCAGVNDMDYCALRLYSMYLSVLCSMYDLVFHCELIRWYLSLCSWWCVLWTLRITDFVRSVMVKIYWVVSNW